MESVMAKSTAPMGPEGGSTRIGRKAGSQVPIPWRLAPCLAVSVALVAPAWAQPARDGGALAAELAALLPTEAAGTAELPGAMLRVEAPGLGLVWTDAVGVSDLGTGEALRPDQTLRIASMTKSFVAAAVLRLVEEGRLDLDASIADHLRPETATLLRAGGYDPGAINLQMLLQHTSGLFDFATSEAYLGRVASDPRHRWTREEQVALAMEAGEPTSAPGEAYAYSDTGYVLLGEIIETATGRPMAEALRDLLRFKELGMAGTWFESLEPVPPGAPPRAHQYLQTLDANDFDPSLDLWGGGGLVSNLEDVASFYRTLLTGDLFEDPATLDLMIEVTPASVEAEGHGYGMGLVREEIEGVTCYGHGGFWSTLAWHCPEIDLTVAAAANNVTAKDVVSDMVQRAVAIVAGATDEAP
jgi:D-alanyl-D-alanine carboxypeptidase